MKIKVLTPLVSDDQLHTIFSKVTKCLSEHLADVFDNQLKFEGNSKLTLNNLELIDQGRPMRTMIYGWVSG